MICFKGIENITENFRGSYVTVGNFDGVHLSHQFICRKLACEAREASAKSLVITFEPHPKMILHPAIKPFYLITTLEEKLELLEKCGIDGVLIIPFSRDYAETTAGEFCHDLLWKRLAIKKIIIGHDYTFGKGKEGNSEYLKACGRELGFAVEEIDAFKVGEDIVSSTLIRTLLQKGKIKAAARLLDRYYNAGGIVVAGQGRGLILGFPTANVVSEKDLLPSSGIYAAFTDVDGRCYQAALNIGAKPTFNEYNFTFEVHLLDFAREIRGKRINVFFVEKIRDIVKFDNPEELKKQIAADVQRTKEILAVI